MKVIWHCQSIFLLLRCKETSSRLRKHTTSGSAPWDGRNQGGTPNRPRRPLDPPEEDDDTGEEAECTEQTCGLRTIPVDSPDTTAIEYLGTGYNYFEGNPRGGVSTELDPGFRANVIQMKPDFAVLSDHMVPIGTEFRHVTSCQFESSSRELNIVSDYTSELKKESSQTKTSGFSLNLGIFSYSNKKSFTESTRYRLFAQRRSQSQKSVFQSRALCPEFERKLQRYYKHNTTAAFSEALKLLPVLPSNFAADFCSSSRALDSVPELNMYREFVEEYGTHFVVKLVLGAKHVFTTALSSSDVLDLREKNIEVATSLSSKTMFDFNFEADVSVGVEKGPVSVGGQTTIVYAGDVSNSNQRSSYEQRKRLEIDQIREKTLTVAEVNVGGTPPSDGNWKTWAATAAERPMPIQYEVAPLTELMKDSPEVAFSFFEAIKCLYPEEAGQSYTFPSYKGMKYGVSAPDGNVITSYSFDPQGDQKVAAILRDPELGGNETDESDENETPHFRYDIMWDGSAETVSAVFSAFVRDNISPNTQEDENELGFFDDRFSQSGALAVRNSLRLYGLSLDPGLSTIAVLGEQKIELLDRRQLSSFSFLAAENLGQTGCVVGVVNPMGYSVNRVFGSNLGYSISQSNDRTFNILLPQQMPDTTFITFPLWFPSTGDTYPQNSGEISIATGGCSSTSDWNNVRGRRGDSNVGAVCKVQVGARQQEGAYRDWSKGVNATDPLEIPTDQFLGFSFLAIDTAAPPTPGIVHGVINVDASDRSNVIVETKYGSGFSATGKFRLGESFEFDAGSGKKVKVEQQLVGGVLIEFDEPFADYPAAFASVEADEDFVHGVVTDGIVDIIVRCSGWWIFKSCTSITVKTKLEIVREPVVVVEHISNEHIFIKAGLIDLITDFGDIMESIYTPKSFHFIAVAPVEAESHDSIQRDQ